jgi:uncharacterized protein
MTTDIAPEKPSPKILGARRAALIFGANILTQLVTGFMVGAAVGFQAGYTAAKHGEKINPHEMTAKIQSISLLPASVLSILLGAYVVWRMAKPSFPGSVKEGAFSSLGWAPSTVRDICLAAGAGAIFALVVPFLILPLFPPGAHNFAGPLAQAVSASTTGRYMWVLLVVFLAPPCEEFLFRGVLYAGFARSWGTVAAAILVSILFACMHIMEVIGYWPSLTGIALLAAGTIIARQRTGSLIAPLAMHVTYNLVLIAIVFSMSPK